MSDNELKIKELEARLAVLAQENDMLAEQAEAVTLLGIISEQAGGLDDSNAVISETLERIIILKNLALGAFGVVEKDGIRLLRTSPDFSSSGKDAGFLPLDADTLAALAGSPVLIPDSRAGNLFPGPGAEDGTMAIAVFPAGFRGMTDGVFIFAGPGRERDRLASMMPLLARVTGIIVSRLDNLALMDDLRKLNSELDRKVEERTRELADSEEKFRLFFENQPLYCYMVSPSGVILEANHAALGVLGLSRREVIGTPLASIYAPECLEQVERNLVQWNKTGVLRDVEMKIPASDGTLHTVILNADAVRDRNGKIIHSISVQQDITERVAAEEGRRLLATAVEHSAESVFITDAQNRIIYANQGFEALTGFTPGEVVGKTPRILKSGEHDKDFYTDIKKTIYGGRPWNGYMVIGKKDGKTAEIHAVINPMLDTKDRITHFVSVHRDMTLERREERRLQQNQRLEALGTLAGGIAHDLNNILTPIIGYTDLSMSFAPSQSKLRHNLEQVSSAAGRARDLVARILAAGRGREKACAPVGPASIIEEAAKLLRGALPATIEIRLEIDAPGAVIMSDPTEIHQVIMNLCTNAGLAMENGGVLTIGLSEVEIGRDLVEAHPGLSPGPGLRLMVRDTGCGIPKDILNRIFEPYFTTRPEGRGSGLGLAVIHGIVTSCGGAISVYSEPGRGAEFNLYFPAIKELAKEKTNKPEYVVGGNERILVVDDEPAITALVEEILGHHGYQVTTVNDPLRALELLARNPGGVDLLVSDMTMPGMTGDVLAVKAGKLRPDLPVILCTGFSERMNDKLAREMGIAAFLHKPVSSGELLRTVRRVLDALK
ncbi:MAG: PAS domain S-box protein [Deltaproteobacteria bacterium]|nr:PAS domain S-box protein [Deltaproteobacteria bacterium]